MFDADWTAKTDSRLRIAKWHLDELARTQLATTVETIEFANRAADHADVVTVFSAGTVEARLNTFILSPLVVMEEEGPRRFIAELLTKYLRLDMPRKLQFLRNRVPALKNIEVLDRVRDLCERRNAILHTAFKYEEVKSLPTEPYVPGLHDHLPESAFEQRPRLSSGRSFPRPPLEQALPTDLEGDPLPLRDVVERGHFRKRCHVCASLGLDHEVLPDRHRNSDEP